MQKNKTMLVFFNMCMPKVPSEWTVVIAGGLEMGRNGRKLANGKQRGDEFSSSVDQWENKAQKNLCMCCK